MVWLEEFHAVKDGLWLHLQAGVESVEHLLGDTKVDLDVLVDPQVDGSRVPHALINLLQVPGQLGSARNIGKVEKQSQNSP